MGKENSIKYNLNFDALIRNCDAFSFQKEIVFQYGAHSVTLYKTLCMLFNLFYVRDVALRPSNRMFCGDGINICGNTDQWKLAWRTRCCKALLKIDRCCTQANVSTVLAKLHNIGLHDFHCALTSVGKSSLGVRKSKNVCKCIPFNYLLNFIDVTLHVNSTRHWYSSLVQISEELRVESCKPYRIVSKKILSDFYCWRNIKSTAFADNTNLNIQKWLQAFADSERKEV